MPAKRMEDIAAYMKQMKFRRKTFGGVDEADVWRQLEGLHQEYQAAFDAQWERSRALIEEREAEIHRLTAQIGKTGASRGDANG